MSVCRKACLAVLLAAGLLAMTFGCSSSKATVRGKVRFNDEPLTAGEISFVGEDGKSRSSTISGTGTYEIVDAPIGPVMVGVVATKVITKPGKSTIAAPSAIGGTVTRGTPAAPVTYTVSVIPVRYNEPHSSGLKFTISGGNQEINIDLKK